MHPAHTLPVHPFAVTRAGETSTIALPATLIIANRQQLKHHVLDELEAGAREVLLDCGALIYADASGLGVLVSARKSCESRGARFVLANVVDEDVVALLKITHLDSVFAFSPPLPEAA